MSPYEPVSGNPETIGTLQLPARAAGLADHASLSTPARAKPLPPSNEEPEELLLLREGVKEERESLLLLLLFQKELRSVSDDDEEEEVVVRPVLELVDEPDCSCVTLLHERL